MRFASHAVVAASLALVVGCGGTQGGTGSTGSDGEWPDVLVAGPGTGPAIYLDASSEAPAIGYISPGVEVEIQGPPEGDRIPIRIQGPLKVRGWLSLSRLAARVQERGRVPGTPAYVGPNDLVRVLGRAEDDQLRIEVRPVLGGTATLGPFIGTYPADRLGTREVDPDQAGRVSSGTPHRLPEGEEVAVYDRPDGEVVATLPALDPPLVVVVLRDGRRWQGVRAGTGPYLIGYVNADLVEVSEGPRAGDDASTTRSDGVPSRLEVEGDQPLWRLATGARIKWNDRTMGILAAPAFAREMNRYEDTGEADVFVAVNDDVALRGMVTIDSLQPYEGPGGRSARPAPAAPEAGDGGDDGGGDDGGDGGDGGDGDE